jgi:hypothetical protein
VICCGVVPHALSRPEELHGGLLSIAVAARTEAAGKGVAKGDCLMVRIWSDSNSGGGSSRWT